MKCKTRNIVQLVTHLALTFDTWLTWVCFDNVLRHHETQHKYQDKPHSHG